MNVPEADPEFEALLDYLKHSQGCDLTGYKRSTLMRRFRYRMQAINLNNYSSYLQYLQCHSQEYLNLLNNVLINVSSFFRDHEVWDYLRTDIIPRIIVNNKPDQPIRVWSAGCANGQEICSLLILLAEALGIESCVKRVQCYATEIDQEALQQARKVTYSDLEIIGIPVNLLEKYFEQTEKGFVFNPQLRRTIIFGRHDLAQNAPMSKLDLLICRNVFIYFNSETQASILIRFHFGLKNTGFLLLGKTEILVNHGEIFKPINLKHRVYTKGLNLQLQDYLSMKYKSFKHPSADLLTTESYFWKTAFETSPVAQLAVNFNGSLIRANQQAILLFTLTLDDWKRPFLEIEPGKIVARHALIKTFYRYRRRVTLRNVEWVSSQGIQYFNVEIAPVFKSSKELLGILLTFVDKTHSTLLAEKLESTDSQLARVSQILQLRESQLNTAQMELEAAHQEIQLLSQETDNRN